LEILAIPPTGEILMLRYMTGIAHHQPDRVFENVGEVRTFVAELQQNETLLHVTYCDPAGNILNDDQAEFNPNAIPGIIEEAVDGFYQSNCRRWILIEQTSPI
jgi:hypothetical protein